MDTRMPPTTEFDRTAPHAAQGPRATGSERMDTPAVALSIQNQMARLNMVQAHTAKRAAHDKVGEVKETQQEVRALKTALAELQTYKGRIVDRCNMKQMEALLNRHGISLTFHTEKSRVSFNWRRGKSDTGFIERTPHREYCGNDQTDVNLRALSGVQEQTTAKMQSAMTQLQDFMAQYQSYVDGARTAAAKANELMMKLAR